MANDEARHPRATETSRLLRELLWSRLEYRRLWQGQAERRRSEAISKAGVARVLALHLWGSGERPDSDTSLPRDLKDRVRRALSGELITPQTLTWLIEAFGMDERDERSLWATFAGDRDRQAGISHTITTDRALAVRQQHRTIALFERYMVAEDRSVLARRTLHTIMALEDGVDAYPFTHESEVECIRVIYGGRLGESYMHGNGLHTDAIVLDRNLRQGETASLEYACDYPGGAFHPTEVRRPAHGRSENIDIAVQFHQASLPRAIFWAVWQDHREGGPVANENVALDGHGSARRFVRFIEHTVVGFRWQW
jgi:hypothetical protein